MLYTGRWLSSLSPFHTEVTESGGKRDVINVDFIWAFSYKLAYSDASYPDRIIVLLFAGYLTGVASGAVFVIYK